MLITIMMVALIAATMMMNAVKIDPREPAHTDLISKFHSQIINEGGYWSDDALSNEINYRMELHRRNFKDEDIKFRIKFNEILYQSKKIRDNDPDPQMEKLLRERPDFFCLIVEDRLRIEERKLNESECTCTPTTTCRKHRQRKFTIKRELGFQLEDLRKDKEVLLKDQDWEIASIDKRILDLENEISLLPDVVEGYNVIDHPSNF